MEKIIFFKIRYIIFKKQQENKGTERKFLSAGSLNGELLTYTLHL